MAKLSVASQVTFRLYHSDRHRGNQIVFPFLTRQHAAINYPDCSEWCDGNRLPLIGGSSGPVVPFSYDVEGGQQSWQPPKRLSWPHCGYLGAVAQHQASEPHHLRFPSSRF